MQVFSDSLPTVYRTMEGERPWRIVNCRLERNENRNKRMDMKEHKKQRGDGKGKEN